jgi:hypothetical protein
VILDGRARSRPRPPIDFSVEVVRITPMLDEETKASCPVAARIRGRSRLCAPRGFSLIEVQVAIVVFVFGMLAFLGYTRVNGALIGSAESARSIDGYADLTAERAILVIASPAGTTTAPACDVRLESIDTDGLYPVLEVSVARSTP